MKLKPYLAAAAAFGLWASASAAVTLSGPTAFDNGYATTVTYDETLPRSSANGRNNALNALGATDGAFFELLVGEVVDFTFGAQFSSPGSVVEVTFGNPANYFENVKISVAMFGGPFVEVTGSPISNAGAQTDPGAVFTFAGTGFQTLRMEALQSPNGVGGFDVDSVRVTPDLSTVPDLAPVPLPAGGLLLVTSFAGFGALRMRKRA